MDYRAELQILLDDENMEFETWISGYPVNECPSLILEYKTFMQKCAIENDDYEAVAELQELDELAEKIENISIDVLAERQEKINQMKILKERFELLKEELARTNAKEIQVSNETLDYLRDIVKYMKSQGIYDEETWKKLQHLL